jgi:hypothetical protein
MVEKNQQISKWSAICTKSRFVNQPRFVRLSETNLFAHLRLLPSIWSSGEIADFDRGDLYREKASVVVLNIDRSARIYRQVSSAIMGMFLEIVGLCATRIYGDINNDCVVGIVDINMLIDLGWKTPFDHPGDDKGRI